jgi:hypothetical protein
MNKSNFLRSVVSAGRIAVVCVCSLLLSLLICVFVSASKAQQNVTSSSPDAVAQAQTPIPVQATRPEQRKTDHDRSSIFGATNAQSSSPVFQNQPKQGKNSGFDFYRDPLNADRPSQAADEIMQQLIAAKPAVMEAQRRLLERRYELNAKLDPQAKMSRGKALAVGPTARLANGITWQQLAEMPPEDIRSRDIFPYPSLPHPLQTVGGQVFPKMQIQMFPRLERVDVDFDLPEVFLPEFPPAMFLSSRPELGDVSRGEVISINNYFY